MVRREQPRTTIHRECVKKIIFNIPGLVILVSAFGIGMVAQGLATGHWETDTGIGPLIAGLLSSVVDFLYRYSRFEEEGRWRFLKPTTGGQLMFIPAWLIGIAWIGLGVDELVADHGRQVSEHERFMGETLTLLEETVEHLETINTRDAWQAAQPRVERCQQRLRELGPFYRGLDDRERRRLDRKYSTRVNRAVEGLNLQVARLNLLPQPKRQQGDAPPE